MGQFFRYVLELRETLPRLLVEYASFFSQVLVKVDVLVGELLEQFATLELRLRGCRMALAWHPVVVQSTLFGIDFATLIILGKTVRSFLKMVCVRFLTIVLSQIAAAIIFKSLLCRIWPVLAFVCKLG